MISVLRGADLAWADLSGSFLGALDAKGAILTKANLSNTNLTGADFKGAYMDWTNLTGAKFEQTRMPDGKIRFR